MRKKVQNIARKIHKKLDLGSYSRIDFIVVNDKEFMVSRDNFYVLEANTIPGLTPGSLFPKAAKAAGISFEALMDKLIKLSL